MKPLNFNSLRLLLASAVIVSHSPDLIYGEPSHELLHLAGFNVTLGHVAVRCFFILSGFLIAGSWFSDPRIISFTVKRVLRIYPAFIVCSVLCLSIGLAAGGSLDLIKSVGRIATLTQPGVNGMSLGEFFNSLNGSMWTIVFEFTCYAMMAGLGAFGLIRGFKTALASLIACLALTFAPFRENGIGYYAGMFFSLSPWFLAGVCVYFKRHLLAGLKLPALELDLSYGIYLYGWPVQKVLIVCFPEIDQAQLSLAATIIAAMLAYVSFKIIEEPCLSVKDKLSNALSSGWANYCRLVSEPLTAEQREINFHVGF